MRAGKKFGESPGWQSISFEYLQRDLLMVLFIKCSKCVILGNKRGEMLHVVHSF